MACKARCTNVSVTLGEDLTKTLEPQNLHWSGRSLNHLPLGLPKTYKGIKEMSYSFLTGSGYFNFINVMSIYDVLLVINTISFSLNQLCPLDIQNEQ